jgi:hypothetical protein
MEKTLLENLRHNQAFDAALKKGESIDRIVAAYILSILFQPDPAVRSMAITTIESRVLTEYAVVIQPAAITIGIQNARRVLAKMKSIPAPDTSLATVGKESVLAAGELAGPAIALTAPINPTEVLARRAAVIDANLRPATRVQIVQRVVNDKANTLQNRIDAFYLEPGQSTQQKIRQLKAEHVRSEQARKQFDADYQAFLEGRTRARPRKPALDYVSRFTEDVKTGVREQARRAGTEAEIGKFTEAGKAELAWCTVNASQACPDCRLRHGAKGDASFWDREGRPGSGRTICGSRCFCLLIPAELIRNHPGLKNGLNQPRQGVMTTPAEAARFNASR